MSWGYPIRKTVRTAALLALVVVFLAAQSGFGATPQRMQCSMDMPGMEDSAMSGHGSAMSALDCCNSMTQVAMCEMPMMQVSAGCCRVEQDHSVQKQAPSVSTDRCDVSAEINRPVGVTQSEPRFVSLRRLAPHLPPVLDRKADLRI